MTRRYICLLFSRVVKQIFVNELTTKHPLVWPGEGVFDKGVYVCQCLAEKSMSLYAWLIWSDHAPIIRWRWWSRLERLACQI